MFMHGKEWLFSAGHHFSHVFSSFSGVKKQGETERTARARLRVFNERNRIDSVKEREWEGEKEKERTDERSPPKKQRRQLACRHGGASGFRILLGS